MKIFSHFCYEKTGTNKSQHRHNIFDMIRKLSIIQAQYYWYDYDWHDPGITIGTTQVPIIIVMTQKELIRKAQYDRYDYD